MSKQGFHWRIIQNSKPLQLLLDILKEADGPMTGMEIQLEAQKRGTWVANPSTSVDEIGENPGYKTSGGVRFPDGKYRYWLIDAPGWSPRWKLVPQWGGKTGKRMVSFNILRSGSMQWQPIIESTQGVEIDKPVSEAVHLSCLGCGEPIEAGPVHNEECRKLWHQKFRIPAAEPVIR